MTMDDEIKEFEVNEYITLKLENNETVMYVGGEEYNLCCGLVVNISGDFIPIAIFSTKLTHSYL